MPDVLDLQPVEEPLDLQPADLDLRPASAISTPAAPAGLDLQPAGAKDIAGIIDSDPFYQPSRDEFRQYRDFTKAQPARPWEAAKAGARGIGKAFVDLGKGMFKGAGEKRSFGDWLQTIGESVTRGTVDLGSLARVGLDKLAGVYLDQDESVFLTIKAEELNRQAFPGGRTPATEWFVPGQNVPAPLMDQWQKEFQDYKLERDFGRFQVNRGIGRMRESARRGENILPEVMGEPIPAITEPLATFTDLSDVATLGGGMAAEAMLRSLTRGVVETGATAAGKTVAGAGKAITATANLPEQMASGAIRALGATEDAAKIAGKTVEAATTITGAKAAGKTVTTAGEALSAVGRAAGEAPSRIGALERISKDGAAPQWLRKAAVAAVPLDPALSALTGAAGAAGRGAAGGAVIGGGLGLVLSGGELEAATGGAGSGTVLGTAGGLVNRVRSRGARVVAEADADLSRWLGGKSPEEIANIGALRLSRDQALKVADVERWARGVVNENGGDVAFRYLTDADFTKQFGGSAKGAEIIHGERPAVFVNTGYRGPRSIFHEVFHAIDDLDAFDPQRVALNERLFSEMAPDGTVLREGAFDFADLAAFEQQYISRLGDKARTEWQQMTPQDRAARIRKEVRAESFASMVSGASGREILTGASGWSRRMADSLLLADHASTLGRMRRFLQSAGVEFKGSGDPSEVFFKSGRALTNQPEVDAALRDYMRAKRRVTERLVAGDDTAPEVVFDTHAMLANPKLAKKLAQQYPDWDGWTRNPDGSVKYLGNRPVLATEKEIQRLQLKRVEGMMAALALVSDDGSPGAVRMQDNGHWTGQRFTDAQVSALQALPDAVLSPRLKESIAQLNALAGQPGRQIVLDYNAALKGRKYSSGISPTTRIAVPISLDISKAGNFVMTTLDVSHFMRKLGDWQQNRPRAFDAWGGDTDVFLRDVMKYLDNHQRGLPGATDLDPDARTAIIKRNVIKDLFNVGGPGALSETGGAPISVKGEKDNLIRSRRFDRINRITPGEGTPFPIDYYKQKANFSPRPEGKSAHWNKNREAWINELMDTRATAEPWEIDVLKSRFNKSMELKSINPGEEDITVYIHSSAKRKGDYQATWLADTDDGLVPIGDWQAKDLETALFIAREANFTAPDLLDINARRKYAFEYANRQKQAGQLGLRNDTGGQGRARSDVEIQAQADRLREEVAHGSPQVAKFLPATNPAEVVQVARDQAVVDFARALGLPLNTGRVLGEHAWRQLERTMPRGHRATDNARNIAARLRSLGAPELINRAVVAGGLNGARAEIEQQIKWQSIGRTISNGRSVALPRP